MSISSGEPITFLICFVSSIFLGFWLSKKVDQGKTRNWIALTTIFSMLIPIKITDSWWGFLLFLLGIALGQFIYDEKNHLDDYL
jgi:hypothetical protein